MDLTEKKVAAFWAKVDRRGAGECWPWTACVVTTCGGSKPYGKFGQNIATHVALTLDGRPRPAKLLALHSCNNSLCVNPAHLRWGTHYDNTVDAVANGTKQHAISDEEAAAIRVATGPHWDIANRFGTCTSQVTRIKLGKSHKVPVAA